MKLFLVRHGETELLSQGRLQGHSSVPLNENGRKQAQEMARFFQSIKVDLLFSSVLNRAVETVAFIEKSSGVNRQEDLRLNEISFGEWEGLSYDELQTRDPQIFADWVELKETFQAPGGEPICSVSERILSFFQEMGALDKTVVAVSHGGPIRLLMMELLRMPLRMFRTLKVEPCSIHLIEPGPEGFRVNGVGGA